MSDLDLRQRETILQGGKRGPAIRVHLHDLHATILGLLGLEHTKLTYRHLGRDFRLTDVWNETSLLTKLRNS